MDGIRGLVIGFLGGGVREQILAQALRDGGAKTIGSGVDPQMVEEVLTASAVVRQAQVLIAPMSNTDQDGWIKETKEPIQLNAELLGQANRGTPLLLGAAQPVVSQAAGEVGLRLVELGEVDEIAVLNSIPTAEGAIQLAMEKLPITLHGSCCLILGMGRCAITLAQMLIGLGAKVGVVARSGSQRARASAMGCQVWRLEELASALVGADVVYNTVPALLLDQILLSQMDPETLIIDLASAPGGVDFQAAQKLGIQAVLALGLPGKVAPKTAGKILAQTVPELIPQLI